MGELNYILEEMKNTSEEDSPFRDSDSDDVNIENALGGNMPATLEELKDLLSQLLNIKSKLNLIK